jgi:hypothetical protein
VQVACGKTHSLILAHCGGSTVVCAAGIHHPLFPLTHSTLRNFC